MTHRIVFMSVWGALTVLQMLFALFFESEFRALVQGHLHAAYAVQTLANLLSLDVFLAPLLWSIPILSAAQVYLCAWAMDTARLPRWLYVILALAMVLGAALAWMTFAGNYEAWKNSMEMAAAREVFGEADDSLEAFRRDMLYPMAVSGALWGVYLTSFGGLLYALVNFLIRRKNSPDEPETNEEPPAPPPDSGDSTEKGGAPPA
jgi:hypothetical protein